MTGFGDFGTKTVRQEAAEWDARLNDRSTSKPVIQKVTTPANDPRNPTNSINKSLNRMVAMTSIQVVDKFLETVANDIEAKFRKFLKDNAYAHDNRNVKQGEDPNRSGVPDVNNSGKPDPNGKRSENMKIAKEACFSCRKEMVEGNGRKAH